MESKTAHNKTAVNVTPAQRVTEFGKEPFLVDHIKMSSLTV